jgi:hypothetical protein
VSWVVYLVLVLVLMPTAGWALIAAWRGAHRMAEARRKAPGPKPVEQLAADLRRLRAELENTENRQGLTAKNHRVQALRAAYLDALSTACRRLDVPPPGGELPQGGGQVSQAEIYRAEEGLRRRGLRVRDPVAH